MKFNTYLQVALAVCVLTFGFVISLPTDAIGQAHGHDGSLQQAQINLNNTGKDDKSSTSKGRYLGGVGGYEVPIITGGYEAPLIQPYQQQPYIPPVQSYGSSYSAPVQSYGSSYQQPYQQSYQQPYQQSYQQPVVSSYEQPYQQTYQQPYQQSYQQPYQQSYQQPIVSNYSSYSAPSYGSTYQQPYVSNYTQSYQQPYQQQSYQQPYVQSYQQPYVSNYTQSTYTQPIVSSYQQTSYQQPYQQQSYQQSYQQPYQQQTYQQPIVSNYSTPVYTPQVSTYQAPVVQSYETPTYTAPVVESTYVAPVQSYQQQPYQQQSYQQQSYQQQPYQQQSYQQSYQQPYQQQSYQQSYQQPYQQQSYQQQIVPSYGQGLGGQVLKRSLHDNPAPYSLLVDHLAAAASESFTNVSTIECPPQPASYSCPQMLNLNKEELKKKICDYENVLTGLISFVPDTEKSQTRCGSMKILKSDGKNTVADLPEKMAIVLGKDCQYKSIMENVQSTNKDQVFIMTKNAVPAGTKLIIADGANIDMLSSQAIQKEELSALMKSCPAKGSQ